MQFSKSAMVSFLLLAAACSSTTVTPTDGGTTPDGAVKDTGSDLTKTAGVVGFIGQVLLLLALVGAVGLLMKAWRDGEAAGDDPWDGQTLEWATPSPAPPANFAELAVVRSPEPLFDLKHAAGKDA